MQTTMDLSGLWEVRLGDGAPATVHLPGTLEENGLGEPETPALESRLTRRFRWEGEAVFSREVTLPDHPGRRLILEAERARQLRLTVDGQPVNQLFAGDEAILSMTIRNDDPNVNARKVRIGASIDTKVLLFTMGETDTKYVDVIESGKSADISYKITVANEAAEGPTNFSVTLNYENWEVTQASASQTLPLRQAAPAASFRFMSGRRTAQLPWRWKNDRIKAPEAHQLAQLRERDLRLRPPDLYDRRERRGQDHHSGRHPLLPDHQPQFQCAGQ